VLQIAENWVMWFEGFRSLMENGVTEGTLAKVIKALKDLSQTALFGSAVM